MKVSLVTLFITAIALILFASTTVFWFALICAAFAGLTMAITANASQVLIQNTVDGAFRGRVMSLYGLTYRAGPSVGALLLGSASTLVGFQWPVILGGALCLFSIALVIPGYKQLASELENRMNTISSMMFFLANKGMGRALRHRDYAIYAAAGWLSNIGLWVQRIAVGWLTWTFTESFLWLGVIVFAEGLATTVIIPIAGTYVDRVDRLFLGRLTQMGLILLAAVLATLTFLGLINIWILIVLMVLSGIAEGFWTPVRLSIPPNLVPRRISLLPSALTHLSLTWPNSWVRR